ncbi:MAG: winged helix-turn-helix domain-containing protein [Pseudomonadales bacterium]
MSTAPECDSTTDTTRQADVLLVEDDQRLADLTAAYLEQNGFSVIIEQRGDRVFERFQQMQVRLVILDLMLPGLDGMAVCKQLRTIFSGPILILTAKSTDIDQVIGLESGADDYVVKPAEPMVLLARVRALLRRHEAAPQAHQSVVSLGDLTISEPKQEVTIKDQRIELTTQEFDLLWILANQAGTIFSRDELFRLTRGIDYDGLDRSIDVRISRLRRKLGDDPQNPYRIKTVWGKGYLLAPDVWLEH